MTTKKKTLHVTPFDDLCIIGISTHMKDYKMAWHLNEALRLDLKKLTGFRLTPNDPIEHSFYYFDEGENLNVFNLLKTQTEGQRIVLFQVPTDFLLIIRNPVPEKRRIDIISITRKIPEVQHAYIIDIIKNKQLDPLLELIEFHEFNMIREQSSRKGPTRG